MRISIIDIDSIRGIAGKIVLIEIVLTVLIFTVLLIF